MKDSKEFFSLQEVREYFYDLQADTDLSWGRVFRDNEGYMHFEACFSDDNRLVSYLQKESKGRRWITDGIAGVFLSVLLFIFYFILTSGPSVPLSDREALFTELLPWGGALSLFVGICCVIYGTRYIKRSTESFKKK